METRNAPVDRGGDDIEPPFLDPAESLDARPEHVLVCDGASEGVKVFHESGEMSGETRVGRE